MKVGLPTLLFAIFLTLKLCDKIDWSWWWVTSPLWIPVALAYGILAVVSMVCLMGFGVCVVVKALKGEL